MERRGEERRAKLKRRHGSAALQAASGQRLARAHAGLLHTGLSRVALHSHRLQRQRERQRGLISQAWRRPSCISRAGASISQARNPLTLNLVLPSLPSTTISCTLRYISTPVALFQGPSSVHPTTCHPHPSSRYCCHRADHRRHHPPASQHHPHRSHRLVLAIRLSCPLSLDVLDTTCAAHHPCKASPHPARSLDT